MEHTVYAAAHCWGAPIPDPRTPTMSVLAVSADGAPERVANVDRARERVAFPGDSVADI